MPIENQSATPVYRRLFDRYRDDILHFRLRPGERIDSIAELQVKHGIGRETAKRVLGMLAETGLVVQQRGRGTFVADVRPHEQVWGLVLPFYSPAYEHLVLELTRLAEAHGRALRHFCSYNRYESEIELVGRLLQERCEAVLVIPTLDESRAWSAFYADLPAWESPVVLVDHTMTSNDFRFVVQSYDLGVTRAFQYLMDRGTGAVAFVENELWPGRNMVLELMRGTFLELARTRRPDTEPMILRGASALNAKALLDQGVTGVFCCDDTSAIRMIGQLGEAGIKVPEDIHVASYGNTDLARFFTPAITSVDPHHEEMAAHLCELLLHGDHMPIRQYVVQPELVVRAT